MKNVACVDVSKEQNWQLRAIGVVVRTYKSRYADKLNERR